jgi:amino acid transporter
MNVRGILLGRYLANREHEERKIGAFEGIPAMGLDGLGSSAYGPEAALSVLIVLGAAGPHYALWVLAPILVLLAILFASYWQTIRAYPTNGGAYTVARENLGTQASLLAAAALMIDYVLNVAVGISAGIGALVSAVPSLHPWILELCLGTLALVALMNLRGTLDAGRAFALPTYLFVASFGSILLLGAWRTIATGGHPAALVAAPRLPEAAQGVTLWLLLRAFASGCTAMTGVEAVSNGMNAFKEPAVRHGHRTLAGIVLILGFLLLFIGWLCNVYGVGAMDQTQDTYRSVLSQLASAVAGDGWLYNVAIGSLLCVLALSANTSFVGFPRLCRLVAQDGFLPKPFALAGRRLVFSVGIVYLAVAAGALLIVFRGITDRLIPLFAVGAFLTFTISQTSMVVHWRRVRAAQSDPAERRRTRVHLAVNTLGACTTGLALAVIVVAKFVEGAWITVLVIPGVIALLWTIHRYYARLQGKLRHTGALQLAGVQPPVLLVAIETWNDIADRAISLALSLSPQVVGVHLVQLAGPDEDRDRDRQLRDRWERNVAAPARAAGFPSPELVIVPASYREMHLPILRVAREVMLRWPQRSVAVIIPEIVEQHWYQRLLHTHRAQRLRRRLLQEGGAHLTVINVPWAMEERELPAVHAPA